MEKKKEALALLKKLTSDTNGVLVTLKSEVAKLDAEPDYRVTHRENIAEAMMTIRCYILNISVVIGRLVAANPAKIFQEDAEQATEVILDVQAHIFEIFDIVRAIDKKIDYRSVRNKLLEQLEALIDQGFDT